MLARNLVLKAAKSNGTSADTQERIFIDMPMMAMFTS
jgi:hypothetical protein